MYAKEDENQMVEIFCALKFLCELSALMSCEDIAKKQMEDIPVIVINSQMIAPKRNAKPIAESR